MVCLLHLVDNMIISLCILRGTGDIIASGDRADVCQVTRYYEEYVKEKALSSNFLNSCLVTSVEKIINEDTGEMEGDAVENIWEVSIKRLESSTDGFPQSFRVRAKNIVLATGTSDIPNVLGVPEKISSLSDTVCQKSVPHCTTSTMRPDATQCWYRGGS
ncbi:OSGIN2 [Bugula neritina]|uniref:OSGIN2 n=1 Tax=Bugula neritina TaxID=10212 RepID=A0A7J7KRA1_BUGNE|nr:OSGIN2 [Bugula neritina]